MFLTPHSFFSPTGATRGEVGIGWDSWLLPAGSISAVGTIFDTSRLSSPCPHLSVMWCNNGTGTGTVDLQGSWYTTAEGLDVNVNTGSGLGLVTVDAPPEGIVTTTHLGEYPAPGPMMPTAVQVIRGASDTLADDIAILGILIHAES